MKNLFLKFYYSKWLFLGFSLLLGVLFCIARMGIWKEFLFPVIHGDTLAYVSVVRDLSNSKLPTFHFIGPGYPIFLYFINYAWESLSLGYLVLSQQILTLVAVLVLVWSFKYSRLYFLFTALGGAIYLLNDSAMAWEMAMYPDSLTSNLLIISIGIFHIAFRKHSVKLFFLLGVLFAFVIFIRSSGVFLIPVSILLTLFLFKEKKLVLAKYFIISFSSLLFLLSFYNLLFSEEKKFSFLTYDRLDKYVEVKGNENDLTANQRNFVFEIIQSLPKKSVLYKRFYSWDLNEVAEGIILSRTGIDANVLNENQFTICAEGGKSNLQCDTILNIWTNEYTTHEIVNLINNSHLRKKSLVLKFKSFLSFINNFTNISNKTYYSMIDMAHESCFRKENNHVNKVFAANTDLGKYLLKDFYSTDSMSFESKTQVVYNMFSFKLYDTYFNYIQKNIFRTPMYIILSLVALISALVLFLKGYKDYLILVLVFSFSLYIFNALVFSYFSNPLPRYSFTLEFVHSFSVLWMISYLIKQKACSKIKQ